MGDCEYTIRADGSIVFAENVELDKEDIKFLKWIQKVNSNPEQYAGRGDKKGATPATIERVSRLMDLKKHQIEYRLDARGYVEMGYLELFPVPEDSDGGGGARSFQLTERGVEVIETAVREMPGFTGVSDEGATPNHDETYPAQGEIDDPIKSLLNLRGEVRDLAAEVDEESTGEGGDQLAELIDKVDRWFLMAATELQRSRRQLASLESEIESLESAVGQLQGQAEGDYGMWNGEAIARFERQDDVQGALRFISHYVLGIDTERLIEEKGGPPYDEEEVSIAQADFEDTLSSLLSEKERGDSVEEAGTRRQGNDRNQ